MAARPGQTLLADKHDYGRQFQAILAGLEGAAAAAGPQWRAPAGRCAPVPPAAAAHRVGHQTFKGQLDLERHGGRTCGGVAVRVLQRILALAVAIWHNHKTAQPTLRSLIAYDH